MLTDVEVFSIRAAGLPAHLRAILYPELTANVALRRGCCPAPGPEEWHSSVGKDGSAPARDGRRD